MLLHSFANDILLIIQSTNMIKLYLVGLNLYKKRGDFYKSEKLFFYL